MSDSCRWAFAYLKDKDFAFSWGTFGEKLLFS